MYVLGCSHVGSEAAWGHYVSDILLPGASSSGSSTPSASKLWFRHDDSLVSAVGEGEATGSSDSMRRCYMLFYTCTSTSCTSW